jgi:glycosyltransferase involved in cell wall biosynthesis
MRFRVPESAGWIKATRPYQLASGIRWAVIQAYSPLNRVIRLEPEKRTRGRVLLSYYIQPFLLNSAKLVPRDHAYYWHPSYWECTEMARSFLERGYAVDVIDCMNAKFVPRDRYEVFLDCRFNMERLTPLLPKECLKIFHIDISHMLFRNAAECQRVLAVQQRRGVTLQYRRFETPNLGIEYADCATVYGNRFTQDTFSYAGKPMYRVPLSISFLYPWPEAKDFEVCRRRFMWLGSSGLVIKGLDLVLEAFAGMPEFHLIVCGPVSGEKDFERVYSRELYSLPNIKTAGWVDIGSPQFIDMMRTCVGLVYPSGSEGGCGSALVALAGGLIPILSYESSVDVYDFGVILPSSSVSEIRKAVTALARLPAAELQAMARKGWEYARENHSRDRFAREWRRVLDAILEEQVAHRAPDGVTREFRSAVGEQI